MHRKRKDTTSNSVRIASAIVPISRETADSMMISPIQPRLENRSLQRLHHHDRDFLKSNIFKKLVRVIVGDSTFEKQPLDPALPGFCGDPLHELVPDATASRAGGNHHVF